MVRRIAICTAQVPFISGGAEVLTESLCVELRSRGFEAEIVSIPFNWGSRDQILRHALAWRLVDLERIEEREIDLVIATRFPSYVVQHPNKVVWLVHQFRQIYDLFGTPFSDFGADDGRVIDTLKGIDQRSLGEARALYSISQNVADRLQHHNQLEARALYPPPKHGDGYRSGDYGDYILSVSRLDPMKRIDLLIEALAKTASSVRCLIPGRGPDLERLRGLVERYGLEQRVDFLGFVEDERLLDLYAEALAVYFSPHDEDYGYVSVEAFRSRRPLLSFDDAGGALELVEDQVSGFVCKAGNTGELAGAIDRLFRDRDLAARFGNAGHAAVSGIDWDRVIESLVGSSGPSR